MVLFPDVQRKAQAELDSILGGERLPTYRDRDSLPYVNALCTELVRWMPVTPLGLCIFAAWRTRILSWFTGIPHSLAQDDVYDGYFLMKGTQILVNQWQVYDIVDYAKHSLCSRGMLHDPELYPEPDAFKPERYIPTNGRAIESDPRDIAFGFGRRYDTFCETW